MRATYNPIAGIANNVQELKELRAVQIGKELNTWLAPSLGRFFMMKILVLVCLAIGAIAHSHSHEPAHMKYTKEVNEQAAKEVSSGHHHAHDHGHSHEHGGGCPHAHSHDHDHHDHHDHHGHSHDSHGHSHDNHGHSHDDKKAHGHSHDRVERDTNAHSHSKPATNSRKATPEYQYTGHLSFLNDPRTRLWVYSISATLLISAAPFLILFFIPIQANTAESGPLLNVLLAFGSGGLLGDAFLHLIPHATPAGSGHGHSHSHAHSHEAGHSHEPHDMSVGGWVLAGVIAFLTVEKLVRILRGGEGHGHSHHSHSHSEKKDDKDKKKKDDDKKEVEKKEKDPGSIKVTAYLNLVADFTHNFTDGLAIGASFIAGTTVGVVTMITVLVHEVPHEIGDFAILIQSGYSKRKAMMVQLVTALGALSGCVLSLLASDADALADAAASSWVLPFTAGGFIYIATVSVIPELLENSSFVQSVKEIAALLTGIFLMYLIALYE
ncbi:unnamed protein product [Caenorhabditis auriculariae]|uniref:Uncharacterized protein n=1 Tax=Caenorhabditis auriculariae TaxID=2777116 RepID=A0A8S1H1U8_9PELO|nr:unnamed protein product [Caenorhabditis auriculariae]